MVICSCVACQEVAALWAVMAFDHAALGEGLKYFGKEFQGDIIFLCNFFRIDDPARCHIAKLDRRNVLKRHEGIIGFF